MKHKVIILALLLILSTLTIGLLFCPKAKITKLSHKVVTASPKTIWVPDNYTKIQWAIGNATAGDTIRVKAGKYYEYLSIKKPLTLVGEERSSTIIDGRGTGVIIDIDSNNITISEFTITNASWGMWLYKSNNNTIHENIITNTTTAIYLSISSDNTLNGNIVSNSIEGISLWDLSNDNSVVKNRITNCREGLYVRHSDRNTFNENTVMDNDAGLVLEYGINNTFRGNTIKNKYVGFYFFFSENNLIIENTFLDNEYGISFSDVWGQTCNNNTFVHNNFINNKHQISKRERVFQNIWDKSLEGNYWSDYNGTDADQDGIGNSPYIIDGSNQDNCPLMGMFSSFNTSLGYPVNVISNSTVEDFEYFKSNSTIKMHVSNMTSNQTFGFCRVCIPHALMNVSNISVVIDDGLTPLFHPNYTLYDNGTHRWIYFAYEHSTLKIVIIPEFPSALILPLLIIVTLVAVVLKKTFWTETRKE